MSVPSNASVPSAQPPDSAEATCGHAHTDAHTHAHSHARQPRVMLIHALPESPAPAHAAFAAHWPAARVFNLMDDSLAVDRQAAGALAPAITDRIVALARYAAASGGDADPTGGILFTCSAFGAAIDAAKRAVAIPVLRPNEAAFEAALARGDRLAVMVSFEPSLAGLLDELGSMADTRGRRVSVQGHCVAGALAALQAGDGAKHDRLVAAAVAELREVDAVILGQFSLARAREASAALSGVPILTTPESAVRRLRQCCEDAGVPHIFAPADGAGAAVTASRPDGG
ncbi:aspartate/glutamate racemase family protein [Chitinasiproducens palmae]|uniref:Arylsulfatase n=1 Tax=Chitinasiproducens palmae TaxID=1770053 RepID=A0A1H2PS33_9BURK|nr:aspartate/glutamate racemase family protein [Chitinasiproducens palmae]SDV49723.1 hypothetical protein SAMN05216551_10981 [Chitinasiproducens palmae]